MSRITKSKIYKPFIALLVAVILVFSFEVNKPKAIVPILLWGGGILAGVIAEELLEMGIRHVSDNGKTKAKSKSKKIADEILDSLDGYDFDNNNPTRKADGSLEVNMSANDRAKIARKIADEFGDVIQFDDLRRSGTSEPKYHVVGTTTDPSYNTSVTVRWVNPGTNSAIIKGQDMGQRLYDVIFVPQPFSQKTKIIFRSIVDGSEMSVELTGGSSTSPTIQQVYAYYNSPTSGTFTNANNGGTMSPVVSLSTLKVYTAYLKALEVANSQVYFADGLAVPATIKKVYPVGDAYDGDELPNRQELSNKPYKIPNFFPPSETDSDVEWEVVQTHYDNDVTNTQTKIDQEIETYLENGDLITGNTYTTQTINNYYTDTNYPIKSNDPSLIVNIDIDVPTTVVDDDGGGTVPDGESAPVIDRTLITYAKQTYDYLGDSIDGAITSMRDITDDASGLVDYLDTSFRWLPAEWRALFGSAFILGVFAHFMRR